MYSDQGLNISASPRDLRLTALPIEILESIGTFLHKSSYLNNLSRTCKELRLALQPLLYRDFSLVLPRFWSSVAICEYLLDEEAKGLQWTRGISVSIRPDLLGKQACGNYSADERVNLDSEDELEEPNDTFGQKQFQHIFLNMLIRCIIRKVPGKSLKYFHWCHPTRLSTLTIELLAERHGITIKDLQISNFSQMSHIHDLPICELEKLHATDVDPLWSPEFLSEILVSNHSSLKHLKLGCERFLARPCLLGGNPAAEESLCDFTDGILENFEVTLAINSRQRHNALLQLQTLHLIGFDFRKLTADSDGSFLELSGLSQLNAMTLESCFIQGSTLSLLSPQTTPGLIWTPRLQSFSLRYEKSDATFHHHLRAFFGSFTGLVHLSVLLEGSDGYMKPDYFIENHGKTLKTLVWDLRSEPRTSIQQSTNIVDDSPIHSPCTQAIATGCPGLRELGLSLVTCDNELPYRGLSPLRQLNDLRTLNIRNLSEQKHQRKLSIVQQHASVAGLVAEEILKPRSANPPKLNIIALGAVTYKDRWLGRTKSTRKMPQDFYLCPRYYHVLYPVNVKGCRQVLLTPIAQGIADEAEEYSSDLRIFEPYWLN